MLYVALLHSITLPNGRLVMSELRDMVSGLGFDAPRTLAATGNLLFEADGETLDIERRLETAYAQRFGRHVDIIVRTAPDWQRTVAANPFGDAADQVMVRVQRVPLALDTINRLEANRPPEDIIRLVNGDLWVHFGGPPHRSRLPGALTTRRLGVGTSRVWNTVRRLGEMISSGAP